MTDIELVHRLECGNSFDVMSRSGHDRTYAQPQTGRRVSGSTAIRAGSFACSRIGFCVVA